MIQKDNLESMIQAIGYIKSARAKVYEKKYAQYDCTVKVDFNGSGSIIFIQKIRGCVLQEKLHVIFQNQKILWF